MEYRIGKWIICSLIIVMGMGCASKEPMPEAPVMESPPAIAPPPEPEPEPEKEKVAVTASRLNLRAESTTKSRILHVLNQGDLLSVLERSKDWIRVQTATGLEGWVAARYTRVADGSAPPASAVPTPPAPSGQLSETSTSPPPPASPPAVAKIAPPPSKDSPSSLSTGEFTQEGAVALYKNHRQTLVDGDFEAFLASIHNPPGPEETNAEEFAQMKGFMLEMIPDPAAWEVLKFAREGESALLVVRSDLDNPESITLFPLFFFADNNQWKVEFDFAPETLSRQDPQTDRANIARALVSNPVLQLSGAPSSEPEPAQTSTPAASPPPVATVPSGNGVAAGEMEINGDFTQLKYAYAYPEAGISDTDRMDTVVILANMELDDTAQSSWAERADLEDIGKLRCIELTINPVNRVVSRRLRHSIFDGSPSGVSSLEVFEPQPVGQGIIAGKAYTTAEGDIFGVKYQYRAAFRAEIKESVKPSESDQAASYTVTPPTKEELTTVPRYMKDVVEPIFKSMDAQAVVEGIKVVSSRNTALFEFNKPEVVVYLPPISNSAYAVVGFDEPQVVDDQGRSVPFERESGGYSDDTFSAEIRIAPKEGDEPVQFSRIKGTGRIKYPLHVDTRIFKPGDGGKDVALDGPFVTFTDPNIAEMTFAFSDTGPVRAYDGTGGRLRKAGYNSTSVQNNITRKTVAYRGNITELQLDHAQQWVEMSFDYNLPPMAPKPLSYAGKSATRPIPLVDTPGGEVMVKLVAVKQGKKETTSDLKKEANSSQRTAIKNRKNKPVWKNAKSVMDKVLQATGPGIKPVYFHFGDVGQEFLTFHYQPSSTDKGLNEIQYRRNNLTKPRPSALARECPPFQMETIDFDLVADIFNDMQNRTERGYNIGVTLGRRYFKGCKEPEWQGVASYMKKLLIVTYSIDGQEIDVEQH